MTHWQHPRFHAYFPAGNSYPSILGDMLGDAIGCVGFSWVYEKPFQKGLKNHLKTILFRLPLRPVRSWKPSFWTGWVKWSIYPKIFWVADKVAKAVESFNRRPRNASSTVCWPLVPKPFALLRPSTGTSLRKRLYFPSWWLIAPKRPIHVWKKQRWLDL